VRTSAPTRIRNRSEVVPHAVVTIVSPTAVDSTHAGTMVPIRWNVHSDVEIRYVEIWLSRNGVGGPFLPVGAVPNSGRLDRKMIGPATDSAMIKVAAYDAEDQASHAESEPFLVRDDPPFVMVAFANDTLVIGNPATIHWTAADDDTLTGLDLLLSR